MGWGRMLLMGNWGQQMDIEEQKEEIAELRQQIESGASAGDLTLKSRIDRLEKENRELRLYLAALIRYLGHKEMLRQDEFLTIIEAIDAEDGSADGGYTGHMI